MEIITGSGSSQKVDEVTRILTHPKWRVGKSYSTPEYEKIKSNIENKLVEQNLPIALAAFPFKIQNPLKTIGNDPDWGERIALERLKSFKDEVASIDIHIDWTIITDGMYFADELHVDKTKVSEYQRGVKAIAEQVGLEAKFIELNDLIVSKPTLDSVRPLDFSNPDDRSYVVRAAGMISALAYREELAKHYAEQASVRKAICSLVETSNEFRREAERSAALYQALKSTVEENSVFDIYLPDAVRASIQPDPNRNTRGLSIDRPLAVRISENKKKNLFPWLGAPAFSETKGWYNEYSADLIKKGYILEQKEGLSMFRQS